MLELGLAPDLDLAIFGAPLDSAPPTEADSVAILYDNDYHPCAPWNEIARGCGWWSSWERRGDLQVGISQVDHDEEMLERHMTLGLFSVAIVQAGKVYYSPSASISRFGSQGGVKRHLVLNVQRARSSLR